MSINHILGRLEGELEFRNVVFRYPSRPDVTVLDYISFEVKKSMLEEVESTPDRESKIYDNTMNCNIRVSR